MRKIGNVKGIIYDTLKYILFFVVFCVLQIARVGEITPFAFGMFAALCFLNQNFFLLAASYVLSALIADFSVEMLICCVSTVAVCGAFCFLHKKLKKNMNTLLFVIYGFLSQVVFLYFKSANAESFLMALLTVVTGIVAMLCYKTFFKTLIYKGKTSSWTADEWASVGVLVFAIGAGIYNLPYFYGVPLVTISAFLVLCASNMLKSAYVFAVFIVYGFGVCFANGNVEFLAVLMSWCVSCVLMRGSAKIYQPLSLFLCDVLVNIYFFNSYTIYNLGAVVFAGVVFMCLPKKLFTNFYNYAYDSQGRSTLKSVLALNTERLSKRILHTSSVFDELKTAFQLMVKENMSAENVCEAISKQVMESVCEKCEQRNSCLKLKAELVEKYLQKVTSVALTRGKVTVIDVPSKFVYMCGKINSVLTYVNNLSGNFREKQKLKTNLDSTRLLISEQLFGVADILKDLADEVRFDFDGDIESKNKIIEALLYQNILCLDALIYTTGQHEVNVVLLVKTDEVSPEKISAVLSNHFQSRFAVFDVKSAAKPGFSAVFCAGAINFDIVFGCAGSKKTGSPQSGDTYSILRIDDQQFLMSLCDGMGSGRRASETSALAICLVENFYKAGFKSELIISSVNKFLTLFNEDNFSAVDVCVFNLKTGICDLIKLGSSCSFIKSGDGVEKVESSSLPVGILDEISPKISSHILKNGDMVVLLTDGVVDSFSNETELSNLINNTNTKNPQVLADIVLETALTKNGGICKDDMTVLVGRIWNKI